MVDSHVLHLYAGREQRVVLKSEVAKTWLPRQAPLLVVLFVAYRIRRGARYRRPRREVHVGPAIVLGSEALRCTVLLFEEVVPATEDELSLCTRFCGLSSLSSK